MIWSSVLVISGSFDQLTDMLVFASFIAYGSGAAGLLYMKYKGKKIIHPDGRVEVLRITKKVFGFPVIPVLFLLFCIGLVVNTLNTKTEESLTGLAFIVAGIPLYFLFKKKSAKQELP